MKKSNIIGLAAAVLVVVVIVVVSGLLAGRKPTILQGQAEVVSYKASSKAAGRIEKMYVREGQKVSKGELLYELATPELEAKLRQATAARNAAGAQERKAAAGAREQDIAAARELWTRAEAGLLLAQKNYDRAKNLLQEGVIASQKFDEAEANLKAMQSSSAAAKAQYDMALEGARGEDKDAAAALVDQASGAVDEVESYMADARVYSPVDGEVSSIIAEQGELIGQGYPVVTVMDMSDIWVEYNIQETLMPKIKQGGRFTAYIPALDRDMEFMVDHIAVQADFATWSATRSQGGFDIRTFNVKARPAGDAADLRPGMSALLDWNALE